MNYYQIYVKKGKIRLRELGTKYNKWGREFEDGKYLEKNLAQAVINLFSHGVKRRNVRLTKEASERIGETYHKITLKYFLRYKTREAKKARKKVGKDLATVLNCISVRRKLEEEPEVTDEISEDGTRRILQAEHTCGGKKY
ncbi:hypothetical protein ACFLZ7_00290 [Nanoarchaeota archaeon]